jgi:hypothetical protein
MPIFRASTPYDSKSESGCVFFAKVRKRERGGVEDSCRMRISTTGGDG